MGTPLRSAARKAAVKQATRTYLRRLPIALIGAIIIWLLVRPALDSLIAGLTQTLVRSFEHPRVTRLVIEDHRVRILRSDLRVDSKIYSVAMAEITFNTIVLLSLYLALPRPFSRRQLERLFMGWCVLIVCQIVNLGFHIKTLYATGLGEWSLHYYSDFARNAFGFGRYFTDLPGRYAFPFLIWLGFNWDVVMKMLGLHEEESENNSASKRKKRVKS
jgi:hypothetical protein